MGLNELRDGERRARYEQMSDLARGLPGPEEMRAAAEQRENVQRVLAALEPRRAELLLLRGSGLTYEEVANALDLNPASVGTLISRAQQAFRKEYISRFGEQDEH
jgi:RNA polymerase sigma-70 factor (ECF subfamily)